MIGWVKVHREIQDNWLWKDTPFSRGQAFIDLIMMVNHEDKKIMFNGTLTEVKRGSTITSIRKLSDKWGWSKGKVDHFLKQLQNNETLTYKKDTKKTVIILENYDLYQSQDLKSGNKMDNRRLMNDNSIKTDWTQNDSRFETECHESYNKAETELHQLKNGVESDWNQFDTNKNDKETIKNDRQDIYKDKEKREEENGQEESSFTQLLSFPSPLYEKIFDKLGDIAYRTWFFDTSITENDNVITLNVPDNFKKKIIEDKYLDYVMTLAGKEVVIS